MRHKTNRLVFLVVSVMLVGMLASPGFSAVKLGVKGGLALANWSTSEPLFGDYPLKNKAGFVFGAFTNIGLAGNFSFQPEILYVQKGTKVAVTEGEVTGTVKFNLDYLEIPLLLMYSFQKENSKLIPSIFAGPFIGFNLSAKEKVKIPGEEYTYDFKDEIKNLEYGVTVGMGLAKKMSKLTLHADIRYDLGLSNIAEDTEGDFSIKNRTWLFMLGIGF